VAPVVIFNVFEPLVIEIAGVVVNGGPENVPMACAGVPPLDRVRVFERVASVIVVLLSGVPAAVPMTDDGVAPVFRVRTFEPFVTVIGPLVVRG
jgi:hypothetical protein